MTTCSTDAFRVTGSVGSASTSHHSGLHAVLPTRKCDGKLNFIYWMGALFHLVSIHFGLNFSQPFLYYFLQFSSFFLSKKMKEN